MGVAMIIKFFFEKNCFEKVVHETNRTRRIVRRGGHRVEQEEASSDEGTAVHEQAADLFQEVNHCLRRQKTRHSVPLARRARLTSHSSSAYRTRRLEVLMR